MSAKLEFLPFAHTIESGPEDVGTEQRWTLRLPEGRRVVVGQLAPDLARDVSIRRRYVRDVERIRDLPAVSLAPTLALGPEPDPRAPGTVAPWRMRVEPRGTKLSETLARAPWPLDEVAIVFAGVADAVHAVHACGAVLRDLGPEQIVRTPDGRTVLVDVGLARTGTLSSHTASSLLLQGSSYVAPEQLFKTAVDQRSDVYGVGVMLWQALTGELPFGDGPPLLTTRHELPSLARVRADVPPALDLLARRCLAERPEQRPASIGEIAWVLRGGAGSGLDEAARTECQHCHAKLRVGQRLCVACGRISVRFEHATAGARGFAVDLVSLSEDAGPLRWLQEFIQTVSRPPVTKPEFMIGSVHMYAEEERRDRIRLPARLYANVTRETAADLVETMQTHGLRARVVSPNEARRAGLLVLLTIAGTAALGLLCSAVGANAMWAVGPGVLLTIAALARWNNRVSDRRTPPRFVLRPLPAALPASDPLVARLSALLQGDPPHDVREIVAELALVVQRLVDHRAALVHVNDARELAILTEPLEPLVAAVERHVVQLRELSRELEGLDEGTMVRALASSEARGDGEREREPILLGLDRLRALEDQRAAVFHRLLEVQALLERTVNLGLSVQEPEQEQRRQVELALATLG